VRFIVERVDPRVGDTVLDPAVGTGGFLVGAFEHMRAQAKTGPELRSIKDKLRGFEKKPMPFLLCQMNMLLHEIDRPNVVRGNALAHPVAEDASREGRRGPDQPAVRW